MSILGSGHINVSEPDRTEREDALGQQEDDLRDEVIEAAKGWIPTASGLVRGGASERLWKAVKALEAAERPRCNYGFYAIYAGSSLCGRPAVQTIKPTSEAEAPRHRCEQHKEEVITYDDDATR